MQFDIRVIDRIVIRAINRIVMYDLGWSPPLPPLLLFFNFFSFLFFSCFPHFFYYLSLSAHGSI